jgi:hypothetical protein
MVVVVLEVAVSTVEVSAEAVSMAVAFMVALWVLDMLAAESAPVEVESALAGRACQVAFRTLPARDPGSRHLVIHRPGSLSMTDGLIDL